MRVFRPIRSRAAQLSLALLIVVGCALALWWYFVLRDSATPLSVESALERYRSESVRTGEQSVGEVPEPGVYVYATKGFEAIDALLGSRPDYPAHTTITVEPGGCGLLLRWDALTDRSTTWNLCPRPGGWRIDDYREVHRFFGQTERTTYRCVAESIWAPASLATGTTFERRCSTSGTTETTMGRVVGADTLRVGAGVVQTAHIALFLTLDGRTRGTGTMDIWLATANGLVVRLFLTNHNESESAIGAVRYAESARLDLVSLQPRR